MFRKNIKFLLPLLILVSTILIVTVIINNPPEAKKKKKDSTQALIIQTIPVIKQDFNIVLDSYGFINPTTSTQLVSQVSGKIVYVNENFKNGAKIKKGDLLVQIEQEDYITNIKIAQSKLILAQQDLVEEEARSLQAKQDWQKLNGNKKANALVLRVPQLESAKASVIAAQAELDKAKLDLQRTKIIAPYDGRIIEKNVSIAQVVGVNSNIANIYASDSLEIRLPVKNSELKYLDTTNNSEVEFYSSISNQTYKGLIVRSESSIDTNTKQLYFIAQINDAKNNLQVGEYLKAKIKAKEVFNALLIPNTAIYESSYVYIEKDGKVIQQPITIQWQDETTTMVSKGLKPNDQLVTTTLGAVNSGTKVKVVNNQGSKK